MVSQFSIRVLLLLFMDHIIIIIDKWRLHAIFSDPRVWINRGSTMDQHGSTWINVDHASVQLAARPDSWLMRHVSWLMRHGSCVMAHASWLMRQASGVPRPMRQASGVPRPMRQASHVSRPMRQTHGSRPMRQASGVPRPTRQTHGSRPMRQASDST